ncbi:MAG: glycosyltransferase family 2 protein [Pyrinomonadaceae bacterium]|nr:glycosyltransferase family 2 protein [Phycisphaerales bacterium]
MISYVIPTHNRPGELQRTLEAIGSLPRHSAEVIIVDNASSVPPSAPMSLSNGLPVNLILRGTNEGAAARNHGVLASDPGSDWIVMLDDDSNPVDAEFIGALADQPGDVAAVAAEIMLSGGAGAESARSARESGGLPEVFIGCGVAIRRDAFIDAGGYDSSFNYYAEEYDLAAKLLLAGQRVVLDRRFRVMHHKVSAGRDMNVILRRLVRNNGWVMQRYAPPHQRRLEIRRIVKRYGSIASKEHALVGYAAGFAELLSTLRTQHRREMPQHVFDRFTGLAEARSSLQEAWLEQRFHTACVVHEGKNAEVIVRALEELGVHVLTGEGMHEAEVQVIGTLSPGPLLDSWERCVAFNTSGRLISPWGGLTEERHTARSGLACERPRL